jgi:prophage tail gpP-like protein
MRAQFEGLLGRLQTEKESLQSQRDQLLQRLSREASAAAAAANNTMHSSSNSSVNNSNSDAPALAKMRHRVKELESKLKDNACKQAEQQRAMRERSAACREAERLRAEVEDAKRRRTALQRQVNIHSSMTACISGFMVCGTCKHSALCTNSTHIYMQSVCSSQYWLERQ